MNVLNLYKMLDYLTPKNAALLPVKTKNKKNQNNNDRNFWHPFLNLHHANLVYSYTKTTMKQNVLLFIRSNCNATLFLT